MTYNARRPKHARYVRRGGAFSAPPAATAFSDATRVGANVKGELSVTADTALRLARLLGERRILDQPQAKQDLTEARRENGSAIERDIHARAA